MEYLKAFQVYPLGEYLGGPEKDWVLFWGLLLWFYVLSPQILLANCISLGMIVICTLHELHTNLCLQTVLQDMLHRLPVVPLMAAAWIHNSLLFCLKISYTSLWNGHLLVNNSVLFWYCHISLSATVPGLHLFFLWVGGFTGSFHRAFLAIPGPPALTVLTAAPFVPFPAVCLVFAILIFYSSTIHKWIHLFLLYECEEEFYEKLSLFQKIPPHDWIIIRLVIFSTCQSYIVAVSEWLPSNKKEATQYPGLSKLWATHRALLLLESELEFPWVALF